MMKVPNKGGVKIDADLGDLDEDLRLLVFFDAFLHPQRGQIVTMVYFWIESYSANFCKLFYIRSAMLAPFNSDAWGGGGRAWAD